jgi:hypothetical protein
MVRLLALFFTFSPALCGLVPLPRAHAHTSVAIPLRGFGSSSPIPAQRLIFLADTGHGVNRSAISLCAQVEEAFEEGAVNSAQCSLLAHEAIRTARGLVVQHDAAFAGAVMALESYLGEEGYVARDWDGTDETWRRPYRARFLANLVARAINAPARPNGPAGSHTSFAPARVRNVCVVGFGGAGHTTLAILVAGGGGTADGAASKVRVFAFDRATGRAAVPANDYIDAHFADRSFVFLGDPPLAMARFKAAFPDTLCDVLLLEPHAMQRLDGNATAQALRALATLAAPDHVLAMMGAAGARGQATSAPVTPGSVWTQAASIGWVRWEGTLLESPDAVDGDAILYGAFAADVNIVMERTKISVEG